MPTYDFLLGFSAILVRVRLPHFSTVTPYCVTPVIQSRSTDFKSGDSTSTLSSETYEPVFTRSAVVKGIASAG